LNFGIPLRENRLLGLFNGLGYKINYLSLDEEDLSYYLDQKSTVFYLTNKKKVESKTGISRLKIPMFTVKTKPKKIKNVNYIKKNSKIVKSLMASVNARVDQLIQLLKNKAQTENGNVIIFMFSESIQSGEEIDTAELECNIGIILIKQ